MHESVHVGRLAFSSPFPVTMSKSAHLLVYRGRCGQRNPRSGRRISPAGAGGGEGHSPLKRAGVEDGPAQQGLVKNAA